MCPLHAKPGFGGCSQQNIKAPAWKSNATKSCLLTSGYFWNDLPLIYNRIWKPDSSDCSFRSQYSDFIWLHKCFSSLRWILKAMNKSFWRQNPACCWKELPLNKLQKFIFGKQELLLGFPIYTLMLLKIHAVRFSHSDAKLVNFARLELATSAIFSIQWSQEVWKPGNCFPLKYVFNNSHMWCWRYRQKSALLSWI